MEHGLVLECGVLVRYNLLLLCYSVLIFCYHFVLKMFKKMEFLNHKQKILNAYSCKNSRETCSKNLREVMSRPPRSAGKTLDLENHKLSLFF